MAVRASVSPTGWRRACTIYKPARPITPQFPHHPHEENDELQVLQAQLALAHLYCCSPLRPRLSPSSRGTRSPARAMPAIARSSRSSAKDFISPPPSTTRSGSTTARRQSGTRITEDAMKQRFDALTVLLNGPRHFLMDFDHGARRDQEPARPSKSAGSNSPSAPPSISACSISCTGPIASRPSTATRSILQGREPGVHARSRRRQPLRHAGLCADRRQDARLCRSADARRAS